MTFLYQASCRMVAMDGSKCSLTFAGAIFSVEGDTTSDAHGPVIQLPTKLVPNFNHSCGSSSSWQLQGALPGKPFILARSNA